MSAAGERFQAGVLEVRTLLSLLKDDDDTATERNNAVQRAAAVLLVSHFESFLKSVAEEFMDTISVGGIASRHIPIGIRDLHSIPRMEEIVSTSVADQRTSLLGKLREYACLWQLDAKPPAGLLQSKYLTRTVTSADHRVIDEVFGLMGAAAPVCDGDIDVELEEGTPPTPVNIRLLLRDVVKCRNDIAHGDMERIPTRGDVDRYLLQLDALARRLDARAAQLAASVTSTR